MLQRWLIVQKCTKKVSFFANFGFTVVGEKRKKHSFPPTIADGQNFLPPHREFAAVTGYVKFQKPILEGGVS